MSDTTAQIVSQELTSRVIRFAVREEGREVGRGSLFLITNDLHAEPYGFVEDVFVDESCRGKGYGRQIMESIIAEARRQGCYKIIANSRADRTRAQELYRKLGFQDHSVCFRMDL